MRFAKIVCTLGPATSSVDNIKKLMQSGMNVARLNFSHSEHHVHQEVYNNLRQASKELSQPIAILADLCGPKIRIGNIDGGSCSVKQGDKIKIAADDRIGNKDIISTNFKELPKNVKEGLPLLIDDGNIELIVKKVTGDIIECEVKIGGDIKSRKGLNIPFVKLPIPALTDKDKKDLAFARELGVDYFALSFVQTADDIREAKALAGDIPVIAKIEKPSAIEHLDEILDVTDGAMVARGDLALEVGAEKVPALQKRIIRETNSRGKTVIVATQMLESMIENPRPTRAEVSDVANAVLDGTDALMLSAETAVGKYPFEAVQTMTRVIIEAEKSALSSGVLYQPEKINHREFRHAISHAAAWVTADLCLKAIAVGTGSGRSAALLSAYRPHTPIVGFSQYPAVLNRMALYWGVIPLQAEMTLDPEATIALTEKKLLTCKLAGPGDEIAVISGYGAKGDGPAESMSLRLWKILKKE